MSKVNKLLNKIQKELKAPKGQHNSFGNYNYRSCEDILEAVKPLLEDATLTINDEVVWLGAGGELASYTEDVYDKTTKSYKEVKKSVYPDRFYIKATAKLTLDEESIEVSAYAREPLDKKGMDTAQITGATSSYARKYALNGLFAIDDTKDADATNKHEDKATDKPTTSESHQCNTCGAIAHISYRKEESGVLYCPNFQKHIKAKEKTSIIPIEKDEEVEFINNLPE